MCTTSSLRQPMMRKTQPAKKLPSPLPTLTRRQLFKTLRETSSHLAPTWAQQRLFLGIASRPLGQQTYLSLTLISSMMGKVLPPMPIAKLSTFSRYCRHKVAWSSSAQSKRSWQPLMPQAGMFTLKVMACLCLMNKELFRLHS